MLIIAPLLPVREAESQRRAFPVEGREGGNKAIFQSCV